MSLRTCVVVVVLAAVSVGCGWSRRGRARAPSQESDLDLSTFTEAAPTFVAPPASLDEEWYCVSVGRHHVAVMSYPSCAFAPREVRSWGAPPREGPPAGTCPTRVRAAGTRVVAEPMRVGDSFEALPFSECVPRDFAVGARHVIEVGDGYLVAYETPYDGLVFWASHDGSERRPVSKTRILGFVRGSSGSVLALARGNARLGRGGVLRLEPSGRGGRGEWRSTLLAALPVEPSGATLDDHGTLVGFAQGFVFRVDERGHVENVHYVARPLGRVASIARDDAGIYYLGLECGVLRIDPSVRDDHREEWWSARDGASGRWPDCGS